MAGFYPDEGHMYSRSGLVRQGVDLALHDCLGRADGVPVSALLGGALRDRIAVCYPVFRLRTTDQVAAALDRVDRKCQEGFDVIRFYAGTDHAADVAFMNGFADRFGGRVRIKSLDFSNQLGWREALQATDRLTAIADVMLVESPALRGDIEGLVEFRRRSRHPVLGARPTASGTRGSSSTRGRVDILNLSPYVLGRPAPHDPGGSDGRGRGSERAHRHDAGTHPRDGRGGACRRRPAGVAVPERQLGPASTPTTSPRRRSIRRWAPGRPDDPDWARRSIRHNSNGSDRTATGALASTSRARSTGPRRHDVLSTPTNPPEPRERSKHMVVHDAAPAATEPFDIPNSSTTLTPMEEYLFDLNGFLILRGAISPEDVAEMNATYDAIAAADIDGKGWFGRVGVNNSGARRA